MRRRSSRAKMMTVWESAFQAAQDPLPVTTRTRTWFSQVSANAVDLHDIHIRYGYYVVSVQGRGTNTVSNLQAVNCQIGLDGLNNTLLVRNYLANNLWYGMNGSSSTGRFEQVTAHNVTVKLFQQSSTNGSFYLTNALLVNVVGHM